MPLRQLIRSPLPLAIALLIACDSTPSAPAAPGTLEIAILTTGAPPDPDGYFVTLSGWGSSAVQDIDVLRIEQLDPGNHQVRLEGISGNCAVQGTNPRKIAVPAGVLTRADFAVHCTELGSLIVTVSTGFCCSIMFDHFSVSIDDGAPFTVPANGSLSIPGIPSGQHTVALDAGFCFVSSSAGPFQRAATVEVPPGGTATVHFGVFCVP